MPMLDSKITVVTGAASGFGEAIARLYHAHGAQVVLLDINDDAGESIAESLGDGAQFKHCDVAREQDISAAIDFCCEMFGIPDVIVNNAGATHRNSPLLDVDEATFDKIIAVNIKSIFFMVQKAVPLLRENGGGVMLNVGSTAGIRPRPGLTWYNTTKGAVNTLSKSLAVELGPDNIRVNSICPVIGETGLLEDFMGVPDTPENREKFIATVPLGRLSRPQDIANAAAYLASDAAAFISGVEFPVDGGRCV